MSHLLKEYRGQVDLIYIDPPFDSKADYKKKIEVKGIGKTETDTSSFEEKQYGDIWTNDEYNQFLYERLICDEVFGVDNFINEIIWKIWKSGNIRGAKTSYKKIKGNA